MNKILHLLLILFVSAPFSNAKEESPATAKPLRFLPVGAALPQNLLILAPDHSALACRREEAIAFQLGVQAMNAHAKPLGRFADRVPTLRHLLDRSDLEFFRVSFPLAFTPFDLLPKGWTTSLRSL